MSALVGGAVTVVVLAMVPVLRSWLRARARHAELGTRLDNILSEQ
ncbi:membrane protein [Microbacterium phage Cece]|nr:membrane protein [Microbacterium phage Cece]